MKIVVECSCQTPYEFEVEPVDGQMPVSVFCPTCGANGTEYANWVIQETLAKERETGPKIALKRATVETPPADGQAEASDEETPGLPKFCYIHKDQPVEAFCLTCKKPICLKCMKQSGYFCGPYCRGRAEQEGMDIPVYEGQERVVRAREYTRLMRAGTATFFTLIALFVAYEWYRISGQKPSVKFSMPLANDNRLLHAEFINDHELLLLAQDKLSTYDFKKKQEVWSKSLAPYRPAAPPPIPIPPAEEASENATPAPTDGASAQEVAQRKAAAKLATYEDYYASDAEARLVGNNIWVTLGRNVVCFNRSTGAEKTKVQVEGRIQEMTFGDNAMVIVSDKGPYDHVFTRVELPSAGQQTERRSIPPPPPRQYDPGAPQMEDTYIPPEQYLFVPAGSTVAALDVKLVEKKFATVETMKAPKPGQFDEGIKVTQTREMAEDVFNEFKMRDTGGVAKVDESRYAVTIRRLFDKGAGPWTGEVVGSPSFFALKTVDVLVADKVMHVFNKSDKKIWESKLSYPIARRFKLRESWQRESESEPASAPCVEMGDTLYFFDQGVLTAFDVKSGSARWRMPSVGISKIQFDEKGMLYVTTTSASPESIQYFEQVSLDRVEPIIVKVDPATGKVLWRIDKIGDQCYLSGKYIFVTMRGGGGGGLVSLVTKESTPSNFRLYRLNPKNGKQLWESYRSPAPSDVDFHGNEILFQFKGKLEVLKFLSL